VGCVFPIFTILYLKDLNLLVLCKWYYSVLLYELLHLEMHFLQCYSHNNLGWKIHVVNMGYRSHRSGTNAVNMVVLSSFLSFISVVIGLVR
jgi:hypothetical protein